MTGFEQGQADQPRAAAGVENQRMGRERGLGHEPSQRSGIGLDRGFLEPRGLAIESRGKFPIMLRMLGLGHET